MLGGGGRLSKRNRKVLQGKFRCHSDLPNGMRRNITQSNIKKYKLILPCMHLYKIKNSIYRLQHQAPQSFEKMGGGSKKVAGTKNRIKRGFTGGSLLNICIFRKNLGGGLKPPQPPVLLWLSIFVTFR